MNEDIFKIRKDIERAKGIFHISKERYSLIEIYPKSKPFKLIEEYYETIKEIILCLMYLEGIKTLSHVKMIEWFRENNKSITEKETNLIDTLRKLRNGSIYYGEISNKIFLDNNEKNIIKLINKLINFTEQKLK
jgi:hypothetical protein